VQAVHGNYIVDGSLVIRVVGDADDDSEDHEDDLEDAVARAEGSLGEPEETNCFEECHWKEDISIGLVNPKDEVERETAGGDVQKSNTIVWT
jgi:hypothetical protein